ncbi:Eukaryotic translation initiation factor 2-alpha kinase [Nymphon striatum]|nr:Eukaryotic translation initiation factor 2-alpha kinase [Nymphon striatum]
MFYNVTNVLGKRVATDTTLESIVSVMSLDTETVYVILIFEGDGIYNFRDTNVVIVSTLDGEITAFDIDNEGKLLWKDSTGPGPLLSSTISNMQITVHNQLMRLVPSLSGGLYKFDGESVEAFPVTAESLLSSSVKITDQSIITGGNELRTYGINPKSGEVKYICKMSECIHLKPNSKNVNEKILVIKRRTQTVRAIDPMTGIEKWNFSVGQNEALLLLSSCSTSNRRNKKSHEEMTLVTDEEGCSSSYNEDAHSQSKYEIKFVVPEGIVCAVDRNNPNNIIWKKKLSSPVVNAWEMNNEYINKFDLFHDRSIPALQTNDGNKDERRKPLMYMGKYTAFSLYNKQLYIQEAFVQLDRNRITYLKDPHLNYQFSQLRLPWKPFSATGVMKTAVLYSRNEAEVLMDESNANTALTINYQTCNSQNGYYLYDEEPVVEKQGNVDTSTNETGSYEETIDQIVIMSLWHWWREVLAISIATSIFVNVLISKMKHKFYPRPLPNNEASSSANVSSESSNKEKDKEEFQVQNDPSSDPATTASDFVSRYETDFKVVRCLGKGGFGKVFEAKNNIDDCHYAVKRICLPNRENAREKVMREVKALAKLEHYGIVRYFNAWMECPPPGWQDKQDVILADNESFSPSLVTSAKKSEPCFPSSDNTNRKTFDTLNSGTNPFTVNSDQSLKEDTSSFGIVFEHSKTPFQQNEESTDFSHHLGIINNISDDSSSDNDNKNEVPDWLIQKENTQTDSIVFENSGCCNNEECSVIGEEMQLCKKETLKDWMSENNKTREKLEILDIFDQILCAVQYVHEQNLMHRDLKPSNIFFSMDGLVKIGDFGLVTAMTENQIDPSHTPLEQKNHDQNHTDQVGTQLYMSPEQIARKPYNHQVDIFSLGLILFELLVPFGTAMERVRTMSDVKRHLFPEHFKHSKECQLLRNILSHNPEDRPEASDIKRELQEMNDNFEAKVPQRHKRTNSRTVSTSSTDDTL